MQQENLVGLIFNTIGVSDGISNGTDGMRFSLVSRDIIADSIETVVSAQWYDAVLAVVGCDKNMSGSIIAMGRLNRPAIMVYGETIHSGKWKGESLNIVSAFEALDKKFGNTISDEDYKGICRLFGVTRQAYYQYFERNIDTELEHELIIAEVLKIRRQNPRIGTRKLYVMLECFMHEHQIKMGRDVVMVGRFFFRLFCFFCCEDEVI